MKKEEIADGVWYWMLTFGYFIAAIILLEQMFEQSLRVAVIISTAGFTVSVLIMLRILYVGVRYESL